MARPKSEEPLIALNLKIPQSTKDRLLSMKKKGMNSMAKVITHLSIEEQDRLQKTNQAGQTSGQ